MERALLTPVTEAMPSGKVGQIMLYFLVIRRAFSPFLLPFTCVLTLVPMCGVALCFLRPTQTCA